MQNIINNKKQLPKIGISSCLFKGNVRYDGEDKRDLHLINKLSKYVKLITVCPEVECGFPVPREPVILIGSKENLKFRTKYTKTDHTNKMNNWCSEKINTLKKQQIHGFIFKSKSPSCAINSVKLHDLNESIISEQATGLFAKHFIQAFPEIPVIEESTLKIPSSFDKFIEKVF